tara:strand:- start:1656 stop:1874 length:219 start_codon:yes stop_codon:yes gene_type:complete
MSEECSTEDVEKKGYLDRIVEKVISRKFTVFLTATALLMWSNLTSDTWGMIAVVYIGGQSVVDIAQMWRHGA